MGRSLGRRAGDRLPCPGFCGLRDRRGGIPGRPVACAASVREPAWAGQLVVSSSRPTGPGPPPDVRRGPGPGPGREGMSEPVRWAPQNTALALTTATREPQMPARKDTVNG